MEWTATPSRSLVSSQMETLEVCDRKIEWFLVGWRLVFNDLFVLTFADTGKRKKKGNELEQIDCTPPEHILPGSKECPLVPLQPQNKDWKVGYGRFFPLLFPDVLLLFWHVRLLFDLCLQPMQCLKVLTMSGWNPPPGNRKMHGDLMYLYFVTVEDRHVSITASTRGFYLNQ